MVEMALKHRAPLQVFIKNHTQLAHLQFNQDRWNRLLQIRDLLKPFEEHTKYVSRDEPTLHRIPNLYLQLEKLLMSITRKQGEYATYDPALIKAAQAGLEKFNEYYTQMKENDMYWIASILDPRIKTNWIKKNFASTANSIIERIRTYMKKAYTIPTVLPTAPLTDSQNTKASMEIDFLQEYGSAITTDDDIDRYINIPGVNFILNKGENQAQWVLNWWAANKQEYPRMFAIARDYLAIPGAEVDVERLFNMAREILGLRRTAMTSETLRTLILLKDHIRRQASGQV